ncbi:MAG: hypothetical protein ACLPV4_11280 [Solirubrobacteraceae bacterium]
MASDEDPLVRLEARLDRASEAAERLIAEAAAAAIRKPPPAGWQRVASEDAEPEPPGSPLGGEIELLLEAVHALRDRIPPDLQRRLGEALRELLLALRALIDWYRERSERRRAEPAEVEDIPIA